MYTLYIKSVFINSYKELEFVFIDVIPTFNNLNLAKD